VDLPLRSWEEIDPWAAMGNIKKTMHGSVFVSYGGEGGKGVRKRREERREEKSMEGVSGPTEMRRRTSPGQ